MSGKAFVVTVQIFLNLLSVYVYISAPFDYKGEICDLIVKVPDHCHPVYLSYKLIYATYSWAQHSFSKHYILSTTKI